MHSLPLKKNKEGLKILHSRAGSSCFLSMAFLIFNLIFMLPVSAQVTFSSRPIFGIAYTKEAGEAYPRVKSVMLGSPAYLSGIMANDTIENINGISLKNMSLDSIAELMAVQPVIKNRLKARHKDGGHYEVKLDKANYITAEYKVFRYTLFIDLQNHPLYDRENHCIWGSDDCQSGYGYYVYNDTQSFFGEFEKNYRKEGLFYFVRDGKPCYYLGGFANNLYEGKGSLQYLNIKNETLVYTGDFSEGKVKGEGEIRSADGRLIYSGGINNWLYSGYGKLIHTDGKISEGQWVDGVLKDNNISSASRETPDNTGYTAEEIIMADKYRKAGLTEKEIRKMINYLNAPTPKPERAMNQSGNSSEALNRTCDALTAYYNGQGYTLLESFDMGFSKNEIATCFTGCSSGKRMIYLVLDEHLKDLQITTLNVVIAYGSNDIGNHDADDEADKHFPFIFKENNNGFNIYNCNMISDGIHHGCTYQWQLQSQDENRHFVRVMVYSVK